MSGEQLAGTTVEEPSAEKAQESTPGLGGRTIEDLRQDFGNTVEEIKRKFTILLDLRDRKIKELEARLARGAQEKTGCRLLVVDDAESTPEIMNWYLKGQPVKVACAAGEQALEQARSGQYDTIVIEAATVIEPDVDGMALFRRMCGKDQGTNVIVMSSRPGNSVEHAVRETGAAFLRKPFRREELLEQLRAVLPREKE